MFLGIAFLLFYFKMSGSSGFRSKKLLEFLAFLTFVATNRLKDSRDLKQRDVNDDGNV